MRDILVTGGTGTTGRAVARELSRLGLPFRIGTRRPSATAEIPFDWTKPELALTAFETTSAIYIVAPTDTSDHATIVLPLLEDALNHGVERFVVLSASSLEPGGPMMGQIHSWLSDNAPRWAVLRPSWFMQNLHNQHRRAILEEQAIYTATGDGRVGFIDADDIARVAVAALTSSQSWNRDYILTGPEALSYSEVAIALSEAFDRPIKHVALDVDAYAERQIRQGMDPVYAHTLAKMDEKIAAGAEDRTTDHVRELTGRAPRELRTFIQKNIEAWLPLVH